jgi:uncharacterized protein (TIGR02266 family)
MTDDIRTIEQRQSPRVDYEVSVDLESENQFFTGFVRNISNGGLFLTAPKPLPIGTKLVVRFTIPTLKDPVTATAEVRWARAGRMDAPDTPAGMGVQFLNLSPAVAAAIDAFIRKNDTLFFE